MSPEQTARRITDEELPTIRTMYAETYPVRPLLNEVDALRAEVETLRKDAERWRHVRTHAILATTFARTDPRNPHCLLASDAYDRRTPEWLEERIDAALAADKPQHSVMEPDDSPQPPLE